MKEMCKFEILKQIYDVTKTRKNSNNNNNNNYHWSCARTNIQRLFNEEHTGYTVATIDTIYYFIF